MERGREPVRLLVFSGSLRAESHNTRLAAIAAAAVRAAGGEVDLASMREFDCPSYDADVERSGGHPPGAVALRERLEAADAFVISSPEYNASIPGVVKNAIDWVSRFRPQPFHERHGLLLSASPSMVGGNRSLWTLRVPLEHLGARVYPDMFSLARAHESFGDDGRLASASLQQRLETMIASFLDLVEAAKHYPCIRTAWVEFIGERPDPELDRIEPRA